jgi:hypothetical protein
VTDAAELVLEPVAVDVATLGVRGVVADICLMTFLQMFLIPTPGRRL